MAKDLAETEAAESILRFWLEELTPKDWYVVSDAVDSRITNDYRDLWDEAAEGKFTHWVCEPRASLALIILLDQFPRNMFRGSDMAFSTDAMARARCKQAIDAKFDLRWEGDSRQFFYMPLMHSESLADQDHAVRLFKMNLPGGSNLLHAKAHREIIRRFGRFPFRNEALGRKTTAPEQVFLDAGGYGTIVKELSA